MLKYAVTVILALFATATTFAYDVELAQNYEQFFASFEEKQVPKALHMITPEKLMQAIAKGEQVLIIDVRTRAEQKFIGVSYQPMLSLPMNEVFKAENLQRIPTNQKVVLLCKKGLRCTIISLALRHVGFDNVYSLKGGLIGLSQYLGPKTAVVKQ